MDNVGDSKLVQSLGVALNGLAERNKAITTNIANVSTPQYKRQYVPFEDTLAKAIRDSDKLQLEVVSTHADHITSKVEKISDIKPGVHIDEVTKIHSNGNNVDVDKEMVELAKAGLKFRASSKIAQGHFGMMRNVIRGNR